jgi:AAA ATPase domain
VSLLERDHELAVAVTALAAARSGRGGTLVVSGLPGVGRSALLDAVTRTHPASARYHGFSALSQRDVAVTAAAGRRRGENLGQAQAGEGRVDDLVHHPDLHRHRDAAR